MISPRAQASIGAGRGSGPERLCRAWHRTDRVKVLVPGVRGADLPTGSQEARSRARACPEPAEGNRNRIGGVGPVRGTVRPQGMGSGFELRTESIALPDKSMEPTASSVCSGLAPASSSGSDLALGRASPTIC